MAFHITTLYGGIFALLTVLLAAGVLRHRARTEISMLDGDDLELRRAMRVFGNFTEYVPIALIAILLLENTGVAAWAVHLAGGALVIGRLAHAQGMDAEKAATPGRFIGTVLTLLVLVGCGGWLIFSFFKG
ncbi:MAG: MAPEG family protein [Alphaproteobacteria bacterium]